MSHISNPHPHDPRSRKRSTELSELLSRCPEHLFSTDDNEMTLIAGEEEIPEPDKTKLEKAA